MRRRLKTRVHEGASVELVYKSDLAWNHIEVIYIPHSRDIPFIQMFVEIYLYYICPSKA